MTLTNTDLAIDAQGLVKVFGENRAVDGIDLQVAPGTIYGVLGPNGSGKTTTIRMLATLLKPDGGNAKVFGHDVVREAQTVRSLIGLTGQYASVDENMTATENLVLFARLLGFSTKAAAAKSRELLEEFSLTEAANRPIKNFSGGMRRRLDLAASLIAQPPLIFLDEPTTGLDPRTRLQMWDTIRRLVDSGSTVLLTTQYLDEADQLADRIAVLDRGRMVAEGTAAELKRMVGNQALQVVVSETDAQPAATLISAIAGQTAVVTPNSDAVRVSVALPDTSAATRILTALGERGIPIQELNLAQPTLDEVFLALTGHDAEPTQTDSLLEAA